MNSVPGKENLLKQITAARNFPVRFSVLLVSVRKFIPWRLAMVKDGIRR
jgi:hypothetical protein